MVWEDGFCNFGASTAEMEGSDDCQGVYGNHHDQYQPYQAAGLQPELFFKMSHEIYNYGEGLIGKVAADHSHKWIYKEPNEQEINFLSAWNNSADSHPRTWEAQFQSGIKTIALIAVREGVIQLGSIHKVIEDLSYVVLLRKKLSYIESIPGVLLPHPSSSSYPFKIINDHTSYNSTAPDHQAWQFIQANNNNNANIALAAPTQPDHFYHHFISHPPVNITPSMSSLEALLSKLPSVVPAVSLPQIYCEPQAQPQYISSSDRPAMEFMGNEKVAKEENNDEENKDNVGEGSSSIAASYNRRHREHFSYHHHQDLNIVTTSSLPNNGY